MDGVSVGATVKVVEIELAIDRRDVFVFDPSGPTIRFPGRQLAAG